MTKIEVKKLMDIPKRHTLKHYMELVGQLYGEPKESLGAYVEEQLIANANNLDGAISCFQSMITKESVEEAQAVKKAEKVENYRKSAFDEEKRRGGSRLCPLGQRK